MRAVLLVSFLAGCVAGEAAPGPERIEYFQGGGFYASTLVAIFPDDTTSHGTSGGMLEGGAPETRRALPPGSYARARAILRDGLPAAARRTTDRDIGDCPAHSGEVEITVSPPVGGVSRVFDCDGSELHELLWALQEVTRG